MKQRATKFCRYDIVKHSFLIQRNVSVGYKLGSADLLIL